MVSSFVSAVTLMLAFIFGPPVGYARLHKRDGLSLGEGRFYCTYCAYRYIRTKLHPWEREFATGVSCTPDTTDIGRRWPVPRPRKLDARGGTVESHTSPSSSPDLDEDSSRSK